MTRIDFYIIEEGKEPLTDMATDIFICRLAEKAWSQNNAIYIHTENEQDAIKFDELLWTFNEDSFVPHQLTLDKSSTNTIFIGHNLTADIPATHHDVLINLHHETPSFFSQFERVAEIITPDETSRSKGRERYQFYRDRGYALETHKMTL